MKDIELARKIAELISPLGGTAYYVGGFVRDRLRKCENKDVDIEIHGVEVEELEKVLDSVGERISIGESFGIYNIKGYSLDIAMPRKEENRGKGHKDFDIAVDPHIGTYKAAIRRDFTINALMENVLTGEVVDHFGGLEDLEKGVIRHINDETFVEDPLRVLRAAQFAARFDFSIADETIELCKTVDLSALSHERVFDELKKALLKSSKPSVFFYQLRRMNQLNVWFPELADTIGIEQNPKHHAEGDVFVHTMMVLDIAVNYRDKVENPFWFMLSAVVHDFGKVICTAIVKGELHSYGHEIEGLPLIEKFLKRLTDEKKLINYVLNMSEYHMKPNMLAGNNSSIKSTNKLFDKSAEPLALIYLAIADGLGRESDREYVSYDDYLFSRLATFEEYMSRPYVMGKDLVEAGLTPGPEFTEYLEFAHKLRLLGESKETALKQVMAMARKYNKKAKP